MSDQYWIREDLYSEVWEQPLSKLADKYGISNVAIGKICRKLKIPLPGRGYWAKKQSGLSVKRTPHLPAFPNPPKLRRFQSKPKLNLIAESQDPELTRIAEIESGLVSTPTEEHPLITRARRILERARVDEYGRAIRPRNEKCLDIRTSKELLDRALIIMNTVLFALEKYSLNIDVTENDTSVEVLGQKVKFGIDEALRLKERREEKDHWGTRNVVIYERSGMIAFQIKEGGNGVRKHWSDTKTKKLEELLGKCIGGLFHNARQMRADAEHWRLRRLEWERERLEAEERTRKALEEQEKLRKLEELTSNWLKAKNIRAFIDAFETACEAKGEQTDPGSNNGKWISWARKKADWIDPLIP